VTNQEAAIHYDYNAQLETLAIRDELDRRVESYSLDLQGRPVAVTNLEDQVLRSTYGVGAWSNPSPASTALPSVMRLTVRAPGRQRGAGLHEQLQLSPQRPDQNAGRRTGHDLQHLRRRRTAGGRGPTGAPGHSELWLSAGGQVSSVDSVAGHITYAFDEAERLTMIQHPAAGSFAYAYNTNNGSRPP